MNKLSKIFSIGIALALSAGALCACGDPEKKEQPNNMTITEVTQSADGNVNVKVDLSTTKFSSNSSYYVYASVDGGNKWGRTYVATLTDATKNTFSVIEYDPNISGFIYSGSGGDSSNTADVNRGDKLQIMLKFGATDEYKQSKPTEIYEYTIKWVSPVGIDMPKVEGYDREYGQNSYGGKEDDYTFCKIDNAFKLHRLVYTDPEQSEIGVADLENDDVGVFEYKFYTPTAEERENLEYSVWYGQAENYALTDGWNDYNDQTGIALSRCVNNRVYEYFLWKSFDENNELIDEQLKKREVAVCLIRYKETDTAVRSVVKPVFLVLSDWVNAE